MNWFATHRTYLLKYLLTTKVGDSFNYSEKNISKQNVVSVYSMYAHIIWLIPQT